MPLAIELAAGHLVHLTPRELLRRLDRRFELPRGRRTAARAPTNLAGGDGLELGGARTRRADGPERAQRMPRRVDARRRRRTVQRPCHHAYHDRAAVTHRQVDDQSNSDRVGDPLPDARDRAALRPAEVGRSGASEWAHRAHSAWYSGWVRATPLDERLFWQPWIRQSVDELENLHTAFNWAIEAGQLSDAVTLHAALKGPINSDGGSRERLPLGTAALGHASSTGATKSSSS